MHGEHQIEIDVLDYIYAGQLVSARIEQDRLQVGRFGKRCDLQVDAYFIALGPRFDTQLAKSYFLRGQPVRWWT